MKEQKIKNRKIEKEGRFEKRYNPIPKK